MSDALYAEYPEVYEALYEHKQYDREVEFVLDQCAVHGVNVESALVVGCGPGHHSRELLRHDVTVTAVDQYESMVDRARENAPGATLRVDSLPDLSVNGQYDLVWAPFTVLNHLSKDAFPEGLAALADRVAPGGALVFDSAAFPNEEEWFWLRTYETEQGDVARIGDVQALDDTVYRWHSLVFSPEGWFVDRHDLYVPDEAFVTGALASLGFETSVHEGYGPETRATSPTYVGVHDGA